jgi:hypothetical protein
MRDSRSECNIGPQATGIDHTVSTDVEKKIPSVAAVAVRARPILIPDKVMVKIVPATILPPLFPPNELLVVKTRIVLDEKEEATESEGTVLDPGEVEYNITSVSKNETGN